MSYLEDDLDVGFNHNWQNQKPRTSIIHDAIVNSVVLTLKQLP